MKPNLICLLICYFSLTNLHAQQATLVFTAEEDCSIRICEPIDGHYNLNTPQHELIIYKSQPTHYKTSPIDSYAFFRLSFSMGSGCKILLFPGDSVNIHIDKQKNISYRGQNQEGLRYMNEKLRGKPLLKMDTQIYNLIHKYLEGEIDIQAFIPAMNNDIVDPIFNGIDSIFRTSTTSFAFVSVLKKSELLMQNQYIINALRSLLYMPEYKIVAQKDSSLIIAKADSIFRKTSNITPDLIKYSSCGLFLKQYMEFYHADEYKAITEHEKEIFGPYAIRLKLPDFFSRRMLGSAAMTQLKYNTNEMNMVEVKKYFNEKYPDSEYTAIINKQVSEEDKTDTISGPNPVIIDKRIDRLVQLKDTEGIKGKYLFIDLWASWCMPCRNEFNYRQQLHQVLENYKDIEVIYISIDTPKLEKAWKGCIEYYGLEGYHFMASQELQKEIKEKVFGNQPIEIPRYFLLAPDGKILQTDLPRPSASAALKKIMDTLLESK